MVKTAWSLRSIQICSLEGDALVTEAPRVETTLQWANNLRWKGMTPLVEHVQQAYEKGATVDAQPLASYRVDWHPLEDLPQWATTIGTQ